MYINRVTELTPYLITYIHCGESMILLRIKEKHSLSTQSEINAIFCTASKTTLVQHSFHRI